MHVFAAAALARGLMNQYGLADWGLIFDNAKTRAGVCRAATKQIGLSRILTELHSDEEVRDTILHEIAHALVGVAHRHDAVWKAKAVEIGCTGQRCVSLGEAGATGDWRGVCPAGHVVTRHRRPVRPLSCSRCSPQFDPGLVLDWTYRGRAVPMGQAYVSGLAEIRRLEGVAVAAADRVRGGGASLPPLPIPVGASVRILGEGRYAGLIGRVIKCGRTRYHILTSQGLLTASPSLVLPL